MLACTTRIVRQRFSPGKQDLMHCFQRLIKIDKNAQSHNITHVRNKMSNAADCSEIRRNKQFWIYFKRLCRPVPLGVFFATVGVVQWKCIKRKHFEEPIEEAKEWEVMCYRSVPLRILSRSWGWLSNLELPTPLRTAMIRMYASAFGCNLEEAAEPSLSSYRSLADFFCRELREDARPVALSDCIVSPADGTVVNVGHVLSSKVEQVKGVTYTLQAFLGPRTWNPAEKGDNENIHTNLEFQKSLLHNKKNVLYQYVVYLAPGDYHRFHSPIDWDIIFRRHFQGELLSVNPIIAQVVPELFSLNERVVYVGQWKHGFFSMTAVGATNVGCIRVYCDPSLKTNERKWHRGEHRRDLFLSGEEGGPVHVSKGELFGEFRMGSTIVVLFEAPPDFCFQVERGQRIRVGEAVSDCLS